MKLTIDDLPCLCFSISGDGYIREVNEGLCTSLSYSKEDLVGQKADLIFTTATRIFQQTHFYPLLKMQGHAEEIYISMLAKDGSQVPVLVNAVHFMKENESLVSYAGLAVTNRKKFEDEIIAARKAAEKALDENIHLQEARKQLQSNLEELDRQMQLVKKQNEELKQFNRVATHDLQEPLRKMSLFSQILLEQDENWERKKTVPERLLKASKEMRFVLSGLQQYIWLTEAPTTLSMIPLEELIPSLHKKLQLEHPGIEIIISFSGLPVIAADTRKMEFVFHELLSNSIRFSKPGQPLQIGITAYPVLQNQFRNIENKYKYSDFWKVEIKDNGMGFPTEYADQLFGLFKKLHPESGRGIGLALCKKVMDNHGGNISIGSSTETGTTVTLLIPSHAS